MLRSIKLKEVRENHNKYTTAVEEYYYFDDRYFEVEGQKWEIIATEKTGKEPHDAIHTVRKCDDPKAKMHEYTMKDLINRYKKGVLK